MRQIRTILAVFAVIQVALSPTVLADDHNGTITLPELDAYVVNRVKELTGGRQHAVMSRPATVSDYPIAVTSQ